MKSPAGLEWEGCSQPGLQKDETKNGVGGVSVVVDLIK